MTDAEPTPPPDTDCEAVDCDKDAEKVYLAGVGEEYLCEDHYDKYHYGDYLSKR